MASDNIRAEWLDLQHRVLRTWQRRYVELKEDRLRFYKPGSKTTERGPLEKEVMLSSITGVAGPETDAFVLKLLLSSGVPYRLKCFDKERALAWRKDIVYRACKKSK